jgi:hypothetical protein
MLSGGVNIIFICCLVFAQSTCVMDGQIDIGVTVGRSNTISAYCDRSKNACYE